MKPSLQILLVGNDEGEVSLLKFALSHNRRSSSVRDYKVTTAFNVSSAETYLRERRYDLLILNNLEGGMKDIVRKALVLHPLMPRLLLLDEGYNISDIPYSAHILKGNNVLLMAYVAELTKRKRGPGVGYRNKQEPIPATI